VCEIKEREGETEGRVFKISTDATLPSLGYDGEN
jgi:hypothetical protein